MEIYQLIHEIDFFALYCGDKSMNILFAPANELLKC